MGNKIKSNLFFSFVLSLVSLAHRVPHAEAWHPALQTRTPGAKRLLQDLSSGSCVDAAHDIAIWGVSSTAAPLPLTPKNSVPSPLMII